MAHIYTKAPAPAEYIELVLCRDVYHCPPQQLPDYAVCVRALAMLEGEHLARERLARQKRR
jgi:hypothetical protein